VQQLPLRVRLGLRNAVLDDARSIDDSPETRREHSEQAGDSGEQENRGDRELNDSGKGLDRRDLFHDDLSVGLKSPEYEPLWRCR
jgi:hypothetical protein